MINKDNQLKDLVKKDPRGSRSTLIHGFPISHVQFCNGHACGVYIYQSALPFSSASDVLNFLHFSSCIKLQDSPYPGKRGIAEGAKGKPHPRSSASG
jgi:hypothetical protein